MAKKMAKKKEPIDDEDCPECGETISFYDLTPQQCVCGAKADWHVAWRVPIEDE